jgi:fatty-acyl-CoA synthase
MIKNFSQVLWQSYQDCPDRIAIRLLYSHQEEKTLTYRSLMNNAAGYARAMKRAGVQPGEVVVLILDHGEALVSAFFGAVLQGAIPTIMPFLSEKLSPDHYRKSLSALFEITAPSAVITRPAFAPEVQAAQINHLDPGPPAVLIADEIDSLETPKFSTGILDDFTGPNRSPEDVVLLQHSSGTTGLQKGVALSHRAVFNQLDSYVQALHLTLDDVIVSWLPLYHDMGLIAGFLLPILNRVPLVLMSPFDWVRAPYKLMQAVSHYRGTLTWMPNFAYNFCAQKIRPRDLQSVDLSSWRAVINCSEPMHWRSHQIFLEHFQPYGLRPEALATCYAMAENVFAVTQGGINTPVTIDYVIQDALLSHQEAKPASISEGAFRMLSAGKPIQNTHLRILDSQGRELPERKIGEIALQSDCMLDGYYNRTDLTKKAFLDGWYLTGDLGYLADGELYVTGRKKDLIIVGGKNIYPQDLERIAGEVPGIHPGRVVAFGVFNEQAGTEDVVIIAEIEKENLLHSLNGKQQLNAIADEIRSRVTRGSDVALRFVKLVGKDWLIKTSSGKIARIANREKYLAELG